MSINITTSTSWAYAQYMLPADVVEEWVKRVQPATLPPLPSFSLNEIAAIMGGEWGAICGHLNISEAALTTGEALAISAWLRNEMEGIQRYYEQLDVSTSEQKRIASRVGQFDFLPACAVRAVRYFALPSVEAAQRVRLADVMLMDKAAALDADFERQYSDYMQRKRQ